MIVLRKKAGCIRETEGVNSADIFCLFLDSRSPVQGIRRKSCIIYKREVMNFDDFKPRSSFYLRKTAVLMILPIKELLEKSID